MNNKKLLEMMEPAGIATGWFRLFFKRVFGKLNTSDWKIIFKNINKF